MNPWDVRPLGPGDLDFVVASWRESYSQAPEVYRAHPDHYREAMNARIFWCIEHGATRIACDRLDPDLLLGWACTSLDGTRLHYAYVKAGVRGHGVATSLLEGLPIDSFTHRAWKRTPPKTWRFLPFIAHGGPDANGL